MQIRHLTTTASTLLLTLLLTLNTTSAQNYKPFGSRAIVSTVSPATPAVITPTVTAPVLTPAAVVTTPIARVIPSATTIAACESVYPIVAGQQYVCATDGNLYANISRAQCIDPTNKLEFTCTENNLSDCKAECKRKAVRRCKAACPIPTNKVCASSGDLYPTECAMNCEDSTLTALYTCRLFDGFCDNRCEIAAEPENTECTKNCTKDATLQCFSDGNLYESACHATCKMHDLKFKRSCSATEAVADCRNECQSPAVRFARTS